MKIINAPKKDWTNFEAACRNNDCQSTVEIEEGDVQCGYSRGDGMYPETYRFYATCAVCQEDIPIPQEKIPVPLVIRLKKEALAKSARCSWRD